MMEPSMVCSRVYQIAHTHLRDTAQALEIFVFYEFEDKFVGNSDKPVNGIVYYLEFVSGLQILTFN